MTAVTVTIPERFNGPPGSANGGYACGVVAEAVGGPAQVRLLAPPPIATPLERRRGEDGVVRLVAGDTVVAEGRPARPDGGAVPSPPPLAEAERAAGRFHWLDPADHPFPTCFVCGPARGDDGLRLFAGPLHDDEHTACAWTPAGDLAGDGDVVEPRFVWAALDCPSATPNRLTGPSVLASLTAELEADVHAGRPYVVTAWHRRSEGRKHWSGSAIHTPQGERVAHAEALWITLRR